MKEVVLDTETTGISVRDGHRIVEIGCVELENLVSTKKTFLNLIHNSGHPDIKLEKKIDFELLYNQRIN